MTLLTSALYEGGLSYGCKIKLTENRLVQVCISVEFELWSTMRHGETLQTAATVVYARPLYVQNITGVHTRHGQYNRSYARLPYCIIACPAASASRVSCEIIKTLFSYTMSPLAAASETLDAMDFGRQITRSDATCSKTASSACGGSVFSDVSPCGHTLPLFLS